MPDLVPTLTYALTFRRELLEYLRVLLLCTMLKVTYLPSLSSPDGPLSGPTGRGGRGDNKVRAIRGPFLTPPPYAHLYHTRG